MARTPRLLGKELKKYFKEHAKRIRVRRTDWWEGKRVEVPGFYEVTKELNVFKMNYSVDGKTKVITNLTIPVGAKVYAPDFAFDEDHSDTHYHCHDRKCRASEAIVHSSATMYTGKRVAGARSAWDSTFKYYAGETVTPRGEFSMEDNQCDSGIHFFLNLQDAVDYN